MGEIAISGDGGPRARLWEMCIESPGGVAAAYLTKLHPCHRGPQAPRSTFAQPERTSHMDAPPREQRARAAFFREKEARRIAKKQRKKERLLAKVAHSALSSDVAPPLPQSYSSGK